MNINLLANKDGLLLIDFIGAMKTPYEGGKFKIILEITKDYPYKPLKMEFLTKGGYINFAYVKHMKKLNLPKVGRVSL